MKNYSILKNIISKEDINKFNYLLLDRNFPWFFEHQTNNNPFNYSNTFEHIAFVHWFILKIKAYGTIVILRHSRCTVCIFE